MSEWTFEKGGACTCRSHPLCRNVPGSHLPHCLVGGTKAQMKKHLVHSVVKFCDTHSTSYSLDDPEFLALIHDCILKYQGKEEECIKCWLGVLDFQFDLWGMILNRGESPPPPAQFMMTTYTLLQLVKESLVVAFNRANPLCPEHRDRPMSSAQLHTWKQVLTEGLARGLKTASSFARDFKERDPNCAWTMDQMQVPPAAAVVTGPTRRGLAVDREGSPQDAWSTAVRHTADAASPSKGQAPPAGANAAAWPARDSAALLLAWGAAGGCCPKPVPSPQGGAKAGGAGAIQETHVIGTHVPAESSKSGAGPPNSELSTLNSELSTLNPKS
ncbi:hypothetical protein T484DRAFT_2864894 [Baffinella frigidus]|nr:hypothetical protein T484DRAFT_2864894 [Cryptophyta sp. CCMP2293]